MSLRVFAARSPVAFIITIEEVLLTKLFGGGTRARGVGKSDEKSVNGGLLDLEGLLALVEDCSSSRLERSAASRAFARAIIAAVEDIVEEGERSCVPDITRCGRFVDSVV